MLYRSARCIYSLGIVCIIVAICSFLAPAGFAQSVWNGGTGTWSNGGNWSPAAPTSMSNVSIGGSSSNATLDVDATVNNLMLDTGNSLTFDAGTTLTVNGTATLNGNTNLDFGTLTLNGASTNSGTITLQELVLIENGHPVLAGIGVINGAGTLTNTGTIQGAGLLSIPLVNSGIILANDPNNPLVLSGNVNNAGGALDGIGGTLRLQGNTVTGGEFNGTVNLSGVTVNGATLNGTFTTGNGTTLNGGQIGFGFGGPVTLTAGSTLGLQGTVTNAANFLFLGNGVTLDGGGTATLMNGGNLITLGSNTGTATLAGMTINSTANGVVNSGLGSMVLNAVTLNGGQLTGQLTLNGVTANGATLNGTFTTGNGTTLNGGQIGFPLGSVSLTAGSTLGLQGTVTDAGLFTNAGTLNNNGTLQNQGTLTNLGVFNNFNSVTNTGSFQIESGALLNNTGSFANVHGGGLSVQSGGTLINSGGLSTDYVSGFGAAAGSTVVNTSTGTMALSGNTIPIAGALRNNGTITLVPGPLDPNTLIQPPPPPLLITSTGKLSGTGTVGVGLPGPFAADVMMQGVMAPGDPLGTFTINGNYTQTTTGLLDIALGGTGAGQFGQLDVTGIADLGGGLQVDLFGGFNPVAGDTFEILQSGLLASLNFSSTLFPTLGNGLAFALDQQGNNLFLDVTGGNSGGGGGGGGGTSVPEPSSLLLFATGLCGLAALSLWRKRAAPAR